MFDGIKALFKKEETEPYSGSGDPRVREKIAHLEQVLGISIQKEQIFLKALRHRSTIEEVTESRSYDSYERLEFLGDAVLDLIVSEIIYERYPRKNEGFMTKMRAQIVKGEALARYAETLNLGSVMEIGNRARGQGIEYSKSILADVFEAVVGAVYVTQGYSQTHLFVEQVIKQQVDFEKLTNSLDNYKSILLEFTQARQWEIPTYKVVNEYGPGHDKTFKVEVLIGQSSMGEGIGKTKKQAEQKAAKNALDQLSDEE